MKKPEPQVISTMQIAGGMIAVMWVLFLLDLLPFLHFKSWFDLDPTSGWGLLGVFTSPFVHGSLGHLISNTISLLVMSAFLTVGFTSRSKIDDHYGAGTIFAGIILISGLIYFFTGSNPVVGASGLVYGLAACLITIGITQKRIMTLGVVAILIFFYGWSLLSGMVPGLAGDKVSWWGHICGAIAGVVIGLGLKEEKKE